MKTYRTGPSPNFGAVRNSNPNVILSANGANYTDVVTVVEPPEQDDDYGEGYARNSRPNDYQRDNAVQNTSETMTYKSYFGNLSGDQSFAPYNPRGYSRNNLSEQRINQRTAANDGVWEDTTDDVDIGRGKRKRGTMNEEFSDDMEERANVKRSRTGIYKPNNNTGEDSSPNWLKTVDPFGGGRSFLLRELKSKFLLLTTPLTKFVKRYLALMGENEESQIHDLIKIRKVFSRAEENRDWDGLINALYGNGGHYDDELDNGELANVLLNMVKEDNYYLSHPEDENSDLKEAHSIMENISSFSGRKAEMLKRSYYNMITGKVVFLMDPILRENAESLLDTINEAYRMPQGKSDFKLIEVMNSKAVMTTFIRLMILNKKTANMFGVSPMTLSSGGGSYGNLADRISAGSANYQRKTYGNNYTIQSRATTANMVGASLEYHSGMHYFKNVEKDGEGGLVVVTDAINQRSHRSAAANYKNHYQGKDNSVYFAYDPKNKVYVRGRGKSQNYSPTRPNLEPVMPVETLQSAVQKKSLGTYQYNDYNDSVLSYMDKNGKTKLIRRDILNDENGLKNMYMTGEAGRYEVRL